MINYIIHLLIIILLYGILSVGFALPYNYVGIINLAYISFFALGAYSYALLTMHLTGNYFLIVISIMLIAILISYVLSFSLHRFKGDHLALITLGVAVIIDTLLKNLVKITNGPMGISNIKEPVLGFIHVNSLIGFLLLIILISMVIYIAFLFLMKRYSVNLLLALKEDEIQLNMLGHNTFMIKAVILSMSIILAMLAGSFYASYISFIDPYSFSINLLLVIILISTMAGKKPEFRHILMSAGAVVLLPEIIKWINLPQHLTGPLQQIIYAFVLLTIILVSQKNGNTTPA